MKLMPIMNIYVTALLLFLIYRIIFTCKKKRATCVAAQPKESFKMEW